MINGQDGQIYARKMATMAARPATAMELPTETELAAPLKEAMGEVVAMGGETLLDSL